MTKMNLERSRSRIMRLDKEEFTDIEGKFRITSGMDIWTWYEDILRWLSEGVK